MKTRWLFLLASLLSCTEPVRDLALDESAGNPETEAIRRLRDRQNLIYLTNGVEQELGSLLDPPSAGHPFGKVHEDGTAFDLVDLVRDECEYEDWRAFTMGIGTFSPPFHACTSYLLYPPYTAGSETTNACTVYACSTRRLTCQANLLNELASATASMTFWPWKPANQQITVPPQSRATRAALREVAYLLIRGGAATPTVAWFNTSTTNCLALLPGSTTTTTLESVYVGTRELYELGVESAMGAYRDYLGLADGEYGRRAGLGDAAPSAESIRIHAARLLVGGEWAWYYFNPSDRRSAFSEAGFCTQPELSPTAMTALRLIRESGLSPANVDPATGPTTLAFADLLETNLRNLHDPTVPQPPDLTAQAFLDAEALTEADVVEARNYLAEELVAFARDRTATIPGVTIPISNASVYAATRRPPTAPSPLYYASIPRDLGLKPTVTTYPIDQLVQFATTDPSLAAWAGRTRALANWWKNTVYVAVSDMTLKNAILDVANRLMVAPEHESSGRLFVGNRSTPEPFDVLVLSQHPAADVVPLTSLRALQCATTGEYEGNRCSWSADVVPSMLTGPLGGTTHWENPDMAAQLNSVPSSYFKAAFVGAVPSSDRLYVVVKQPGATAAVPGSYEPLGSIWIHTSTLGGTFYFSELAPELDARVGAALTPSTAWCTRPQVDCADDMVLDARLPLEDEITETVAPSDFENSWYRYLSNARVAADRTDDIARDILNVSLTIAERSEGAVSELEDICGEASLSPFDAFDPTQDMMAHLATQAAAPISNAAAGRLHRCLSESATHPYATIGSQELCAWYRGSEQGALCDWEGLTAMPPTVAPLACPRIRRATDFPTCQLPKSSGYTAVNITGDAILRLVEADEDSGRTDPEPEECVQLRELRRVTSFGSTATDDEIRTAWARVLRDTSFFDPNNLQGLADRVRFEATVGSHSTVYLNDRPVIRTGSLVGGTATSGLCSVGGDTNWRNLIAMGGYQCEPPTPPPAPPLVPLPPVADHTSLFCTHVNCNDVPTRAALNARLLRAATVARWLGQGDGFSGFRLPPGGCSASPTVSRYQNVGPDLFGVGAGDDPSVEVYCNVAPSPLPLWSFVYPTGNLTAPPVCTFQCGSQGARFSFAGSGWEVGSPEVHVGGSPERFDAAQFLISLRSLPSGDAGPLRALRRNGHTRVPGMWLPWVWGAPGVARYFPGHDNPLSSSPDALSTLTHEAIFDGLELLCEAGRSEQATFSVDVTPLTGPEQMDIVAENLRQEADRVRFMQSHMVLRGLPDQVADYLRGGQSERLPPDTGGRMGAQLQRVQGGILRLRGLSSNMSDQLDNVSRDVRRASAAIRRSDLSNQLDQIGYTRQTYDVVTQCARSVYQAAASLFWNKIADIGDAAIVCANSVLQLEAISRSTRTRDEIAGTDRELILIEFEEAMSQRSGAMSELANEIEILVNEINAMLTELELLRAQGRRALARALFLDHSDTGAAFASNTILRRRLALAQSQYESSRRNAIWTSDMAKRAIEQRFGVRLASMNEDMSLVDAPATWESTVCEFEGVNYQTFQDPNAPDADLTTAANAFIGEYVTKLENFVESYRLDFPFVNGEDTSVVSLRDDVMRVREPCTRPSPNRVKNSSNLLATTAGGVPGWQRYGCLTDGGGAEWPNCIGVERLDDAASQIGVTTEAGAVVPHRVVFGPPDSRCPGASCPCGGAVTACGWTNAATYGQDVTLSRGLHRLSWYANVEMAGSAAHLPAYGGVVVRGVTSLSEWGATASTYGSERVGTTNWYRYWTVFTVPYAEAGRVHIRQQSGVASLRVAGIMLEHIDNLAPLLPATINYTSPLVEPGAFIDTDGNGSMQVLECEDSDGDIFRSRGFRRECLRVCPDGLQSSCPDARSTEYCFWETDFSISQRAIDRGLVFARSGFARGNFNYRTESLGLNVVGSAARVCADESLPSTCYSAGYVPFSLEHLGPYPVRNYLGQEYNAPLFPGVIEHSRAVALERYVSNPISSADRALIDPYVQRQFRGRPLAGNYRLRIWDEPGVNFDGIEDIQVILNYRYWTRTR
jgi:hypothetical protein